MVLFLSHRAVRLPDLCTRALGYVSWLCTAPAAAGIDDEQAMARFEEIFRELDRRGQAAGYPVAQVRVVIFALVAYADERILTSQWAGKQAWLDNPLQLALFDMNSGGEEFFLRLEHLRREEGEGERLADVLECFLICLRLGFFGRYGGSEGGRRQVAGIVESLEAEIARRRADAPGLVVGADAPVQVPAGRQQPLGPWVVPLCATAAVLMLYVVLALLLGERSAVLVARSGELLP